MKKPSRFTSMRGSNFLLRYGFFFLINFAALTAGAQPSANRITGSIETMPDHIVTSVTVSLLKAADSSLVKVTVPNQSGEFSIEEVASGKYLVLISSAGYEKYYSELLDVPSRGDLAIAPVILVPAVSTLSTVTVSRKRPMIEMKAGRTVINVDASITNVGTTILEVLEKSPGVSVDRDGNISIKGRQNVLVLIDGKQTYLPESELAALLGSMASSQVEQIEIITNPSAKYDAAGSTGIIEIHTKKNHARGFNGSLSTSYGQGGYPKSNNTLLLNLRHDKINLFLNYSVNLNSNFTDLYAIRWYHNPNNEIISMLDQATYIIGKGFGQNLKFGIDYYISNKTTAGVTLTGLKSRRNSSSSSIANWMNKSKVIDSVIETISTGKGRFRNGAINLNFRHAFTGSRELSADLDLLNYKLSNEQWFENRLTQPDDFVDAYRGDIPSGIKILSAKMDYAHSFDKSWRSETGLKASKIKTANIADYYFQAGGSDWLPDYGKTNNFQYSENIYAAYATFQKETKRFTLNAGLRYENTSYDAVQLGNLQRRDSSFSRNYDGIFPSTQLSFRADSVNTFAFSAGRRIDRPAFQQLNPFVFIINKYTYQRGNPYFLPQNSWNFEMSHSYKDVLVTTLAYGLTRNYFSQIFLADTAGIIYYGQGNLDKMRIASLSIATNLSPLSWWSLSGQVTLFHKKISGMAWENMEASLTQFNVNINNQFRFTKGWSGELSGFFTTKDQELQEIVDPTGQVGIGVSKQVLQTKGVLKAGVRDIFYSQAMKGWTIFNGATEYFRLLRDSRVITLAFTYRFGKTQKIPARKANGGASDEIKRVGGI